MNAFRALGLAVVLSACGSGPTVGRVPDISPRMEPAQVIQVALDRIAQMENVSGARLRSPRVISLIAMTGAEAAATTGWAAHGTDAAVVWLVRAEGTFYPVIAGEPIGWVPPSPSPVGWIIVNDTDGSLAGSGFP